MTLCVGEEGALGRGRAKLNTAHPKKHLETQAMKKKADGMVA